MDRYVAQIQYKSISDHCAIILKNKVIDGSKLFRTLDV